MGGFLFIENVEIEHIYHIQKVEHAPTEMKIWIVTMFGNKSRDRCSISMKCWSFVDFIEYTRNLIIKAKLWCMFCGGVSHRINVFNDNETPIFMKF